MDHKMMSANQKRANKQHQSNKTKKKDLLKVVYITDPIKFKATASEFRALVQQLTGQGSDVPEYSSFSAGGGGGEVDKVAAAAEQDCNHVHAGHQKGIKMGRTREGARNGSDRPSAFGSYDGDMICGMDNFQGLMASSFWINGGCSYYLDDELKG